MDASAMAGLGFAAVGAGLIAIALTVILPRRVDVRVLSTMLIKLANARNVSRARKLCHAAPGSCMDAVGAAIDAIPEQRDDRLRIEAAINAAFDKAGEPLAARWRSAIQRGLFGAILIGGGAAIAMSSPVLKFPVLPVGGAIAVLAAAALYAQRNYMTASLATLRANVLPPIASSAMAGGDDAPPPVVVMTREQKVAALTTSLKDSPHTASLKDGTCPLCKGTTIKTVDRDDGRFKSLVCTQCGYAQEFANLDKL